MKFLHKHFWHFLPRELRRQLLFTITQRLAPLPDCCPVSQPSPIFVIGAFRTASGLGDSARYCLRALLEGDQTAARIDVSHVFMQPSDIPPVHTGDTPSAGPGTALLHVNGPFVPMALWHLGRRFVMEKRVIGYWAWELPKAPSDWRPGAHYLHEIWVPSEFTAKAIRAISPVSVHVIPHALPPPQSRQRPRGHYGLPPNQFLFSCAFGMGSSFDRKNPLATIAAFRRAFRKGEAAHLAIKVSHPDLASWAMAELRAAAAGADNISFNEQVLAPEDFEDWLDQADAVVSLHRAEGFGLVPAQAMRLGRPVIATNWSGNLEYMNPANSALVDFKLIAARDRQGTYNYPDQKWADPDVNHAAYWMRRLFENPDVARNLGMRAAKDIKVQLSQARYNERVTERLLSATPGQQGSSRRILLWQNNK